MELLCLPDEVLVYIFEYVSGEDKLNMSTVCQRFNEILKDKRLTRKLNFTGCYTTSISHIKCYLKPKICYENVKEFDITSCYWLKSVGIRECVLKLSKLEALYAADTSLTRGDLMKILNSSLQLKRLSWTWNPVMPLCEVPSSRFKVKSLSPQLNSLEFLLFYVKTDAVYHQDVTLLHIWLSQCTGLKELWMIVPEQECGFDFDSRMGSLLPLHFPHLHTLVISSLGCTYSRGFLSSVFREILNACRSVTSWQCFWVSKSMWSLQSGCPYDTSLISEVNTVLRVCWRGTKRVPVNCPELQHLALVTSDLHLLEPVFENRNQILKKLLWNSVSIPMNWDSLWNSVTNLEELNVANCVSNIENIYPQKNLHKLALPTCIIKGDGSSDSSQASKLDSTIRVIVETCPNIKEFEFTPCCYCSQSRGSGWKFSFLHQLSIRQESPFELFAKWKSLRRLKLEGLNCFRSGKPFIQIFTSCQNLESISLKNLGLMGNCDYIFELCTALKFCKNLKDFRIEQPNILSADRLFRALETCPLIARVCVISLNSGRLSAESTLVEFVSGAPKLVFLYVLLGTLTQAACSRIEKSISERCKNTSPALHLTLLGSTAKKSHQDVKNLPAVHYFEMRQDVSRIGTRLGNGKWYLSHP